MTSTIYLTRNGLLEPLGQSQVLAYLRGLSHEYRITLISYEKDEDWADRERVAKAFAECENLGIQWLPERFRHRPKILAPALSMMRMFWVVLRGVRSQGAVLIHARSYIPAAVAFLVYRMTGVPFIFDMRALWPEELITAGRLRRGSLLHHTITATERACLRHAAAVVSLTHAAVDYLEQKHPQFMSRKRIIVIPTCADLDRFVPATCAPTRRVIGCLGTVLSGWFRLDWLVAFLGAAVRRDPNIVIELTTRDDPNQVRAAFGSNWELLRKLKISPCSSDRVHEVLQGQMASVMFFTGGLSKLGSSPTRMGEVLGCGLPVVANGGVGDVARIIRKYRVGVLAEGSGCREMEAAWDNLQRLLADPGLATRCRETAEKVFSLKVGTEQYSELYSEILKS